MPQYTAEQAVAIATRDVSVALSAGAGCGKTFVLTQRFLAEISPEPDHSQSSSSVSERLPDRSPAELSSVVAITFTERAAREMRDRVRRACRERLAQAPLESVPSWQQLVREVDSARISTIHSFCMTLLRSNAVEAQIDPQSRLFDETTAAAFLWKSLVRSLHDLVVARNEHALNVVREFNWEGTLDRLSRLIPQRYRIRSEEWLAMTDESLLAHWRTLWKTAAIPLLLHEFTSSPIVHSTLALLREHTSTNAVMAERRTALLTILPGLEKSPDPIGQLEQLRDNAIVQGGGTKKAWASEDVYEEVKESLGKLRKLIDPLRERLAADDESALASARISLAMLHVVDRVGREYDQRKRDEGWLDFDDLLVATRDLLHHSPDVLRRLSAGISLLMVDEFQDTDRLQAEIVRLICGDQLTTGKLFLVGDVKQSIYRFRRAEPQVFRDLRSSLPPRGQLPLTGNFRSQPAVLNFVNALCDGALGGEYEALSAQTPQVSQDPCIEFLFSDPSREPPSDARLAESNRTGTTASESVQADESAPTDETLENGRESVGEKRQREADWIARRIRQLLNQERPLVREKHADGKFGLRRVEPRDVVVLFRAMSDVRYYEEALRRWKIDHYVVGGHAFYAQQEVYDIVNLCRVLHEPDDQLALVGVLRSPFFALTDDDVLQGRIAGLIGPKAIRPTTAVDSIPPTLDRPASQQSGIASGEPMARSASVGRVWESLLLLQRLREEAPRRSVGDLLRLAINETGYDASLLTEFLGERKLANLRKLIDLARDFDRAGLFSLADFSRHLSSAIAEESRESLAATHPESSNIVRLMTIHQSKGLEFPVVIVADMNRSPSNSRSGAILDEQLGPLVTLPPKFAKARNHLGMIIHDILESPENLAETQRLLYVATTRAADLLILSASVDVTEDGFKLTHPWMKLLNERFDLQTGQPRLAVGRNGVSVLAKYASQLPAIQIHHSRPEAIMPPDSASKSRSVPLSELRQTLETSTPASWLSTLTPFPDNPAHVIERSVSEIEALVEHYQTALNRKDLEELLSLIDIDIVESAIVVPQLSLNLESATQLGVLVHHVMELATDSLEKTLERILVASGGLYPANVILAARTCIGQLENEGWNAMLRSTPLASREVDFWLPWKSAVPGLTYVTGQIDAIVSAGSGWGVIDYKTGSPIKGGKATSVGKSEQKRSTQTADQAIKQTAMTHYGVQLGLYGLAVEHILGNLPEWLELIYLPSATRVRIKPKRAFHDRIEEIVTDAIRYTVEKGVPSQLPDGMR